MCAANIDGDKVVFDPSKRIRAAIGDDVIEKIENDSLSRFERISAGCAIPTTDKNRNSSMVSDVEKDEKENDMNFEFGKKVGKIFHTVNSLEDDKARYEQEVIDERVRKSGNTNENMFHGPLYNFMPTEEEFSRVSSYSSGMSRKSKDRNGKVSALCVATDVLNVAASSTTNLIIDELLKRSINRFNNKKYASSIGWVGASAALSGLTSYVTGVNRAKYFRGIDKEYFSSVDFDRFEKILNKKLVKFAMYDVSMDVLAPFAALMVVKSDKREKSLYLARSISYASKSILDIVNMKTNLNKRAVSITGSGPNGEFNRMEYNDLPFVYADRFANNLIEDSRYYNSMGFGGARIISNTVEIYHTLKTQFVKISMIDENRTPEKSVVDSVIAKKTTTVTPIIVPEIKPDTKVAATIVAKPKTEKPVTKIAK